MKGRRARPTPRPGGPVHIPTRYCLEPCRAVLNMPSPQLLAQSGSGRAPSHLQVEAGVLHHPLCQCGDVDAPIALPGEIKIILGVLRVEPQEIFQCQVVVVSDLQAGGGGVRPGPHAQAAVGRGRNTPPAALASVSFVLYFLSSE